MIDINDLMRDLQRSQETDEEREAKKRLGLVIGLITQESVELLAKMVTLANEDIPDDHLTPEFDYALWDDAKVARISLGMNYVSKSAERMSRELVNASERRLIEKAAVDNNIPLDSKAN